MESAAGRTARLRRRSCWLALGIVALLAAVAAWLALAYRIAEVTVDTAAFAPAGYEVVAREDVLIRDSSRREMAAIVIAPHKETGEAQAAHTVVEHLKRQGWQLNPPVRREPGDWVVAVGSGPDGSDVLVGSWRPFVALEQPRSHGEYLDVIERLGPRLAQERRALVLVTVAPPWRDLPLSW